VVLKFSYHLQIKKCNIPWVTINPIKNAAIAIIIFFIMFLLAGR